MPNMACISPCIYQRSSGIYPRYKQHLQWKKLEFCFGNHLDIDFSTIITSVVPKMDHCFFQNSINGYIPTHCCIWLAHPVMNLDHALAFCTSAAHWKRKHFWHDNRIKTEGCQQVPTLSTCFFLEIK